METAVGSGPNPFIDPDGYDACRGERQRAFQAEWGQAKSGRQVKPL
jgi:hypothetical protein